MTKTLNDIDFSKIQAIPNFGPLVQKTWVHDINIQHCFTGKLRREFTGNIETTNHKLGVQCLELDLAKHTLNFRDSATLNEIIHGDYSPKWIWVTNANVLTDHYFAGWLQYQITVRAHNNLRLVFMLENKKTYRAIFQDEYNAFFDTSTLLRTNFNQPLNNQKPSK